MASAETLPPFPIPFPTIWDNILKAALFDHIQTALNLEAYTIPMYLTAAYSIKDPNDEARGTILDIAHQEMLHLALAGNLLCAVGGTPRLHDNTPKFPADLFFTNLRLYLGPATKEAIGLFVDVEAPEAPFKAIPLPHLLPTYKSIGGFYKGAETLLEFLDRALHVISKDSVPRQLTGILGSFSIGSLSEAQKAIVRIVEEGEGTSGHREDSHWCKFKKIYENYNLDYYDVVQNIDARDYAGSDPSGKPYQFHPVMLASDAAYSFLLLTLEALWQTEDATKRAALRKNLSGSMHGTIGSLAQFLVEQPIPGTNPTKYAGPPFRRHEFHRSPLTDLKRLVNDAVAAYPGDSRLLKAQTTVAGFVDIE